MRWSGAASLALHAVALAWFALGWQVEPPVAAAPIEIALLPPAPPPPPPPAPPEPIRAPELRQPEPLPEPEPLELDEPPPELLAEEPEPVVLPRQRPPRPKPPRKVEPKPEMLPATPAAPPPAPQPPRPPVQVASSPPPAPPRPAAPPPSYLAKLVAELERHKAYPRSAQRRRQEGAALLRFTLARDGQVEEWRIERSSGHESLDGAVAAMIRKADPLPPLPPEIAGDTLELVVPVSFVLR